MMSSIWARLWRAFPKFTGPAEVVYDGVGVSLTSVTFDKLTHPNLSPSVNDQGAIVASVWLDPGRWSIASLPVKGW